MTANQSVTRVQLAAGNLVYTPRADDSGSDYTDFLFLVSGSSEESSFAYKMTIDVTAVNDPATGAPTISGTPEVGETLTASTASIADPDGLTGSFTYQWLQVDSDGTSNPTNIMGATSNTYTLTTSEVGKTVQVEVSFTDSGGGEEERVSTAYPSSGTVVAAPTVNTAPTASDSTVTATEDETYTFLADNFNYSDSDDDPLVSVKITGLPAAGTGALKIGSRTISATDLPKTVSATELTDGELNYEPTTNQNGAGYASFRFKVNDGTVDSTAEYTMTIDVTSVNDPAFADASIMGTAQVGETLSASADIFDLIDGNPDPSTYTYQWKRYAADGNAFEADIGSDSNMYTLATSEAGKTVKVEVGFTDGDGNYETKLSDAYPSSGTVLAAPVRPTAADGSVTTMEEVEYTFTVGNFNYAAGNANSLVSVIITESPADTEDELALDGIQIIVTGGSVPVTVSVDRLTAGELKYRPPSGANGTSFKFKVNDGTSDSTEYTMTITVTQMNEPTNTPPTASSGTVTTDEDTELYFRCYRLRLPG